MSNVYSFPSLIHIVCLYKRVFIINNVSRQPCLADRANLHYVEATILEILRFTSVIPLAIPHMSLKDSTIGGYVIPKGTQLPFKPY